MDGNGRWAIKNNYTKKIGHEYGIKNCISICEGLTKLRYNISEISFYVFSTENWKRKPYEINHLFDLIDIFYRDFRDKADKNNLKIRHYGSRKKLSKKLLNIIDDVTYRTRKNKGTIINLFLSFRHTSAALSMRPFEIPFATLPIVPPEQGTMAIAVTGYDPEAIGAETSLEL